MAARDPQADVILIGSSTALLYTPDVIRATFPLARDVWNLSYRAARPADRDIVMRFIAAKAHARRVIVLLDYFYSADPTLRATDFPGYFYDANPLNDLRIINASMPGALLSTLRSGEPFQTGAPVERRTARSFAQQYASSNTPDARAAWQAAIGRQRGTIDRPGRTRCRDLIPFEQQLLPAIRTLSKRGIAVDIFVPPYSPLMYYTFQDAPDHVQVAGRSFLEDQLLLRRCAVTETARLASVAVWAPDRDLGLIATIGNFKDPAHLAWTKQAQDTLKRIGDPKYRLTTDNVGDYVQRMRRLVVSYRLPDAQPKGDPAR
jgi:hypothetical protein